jgi:hypothetical protein
MKQWALSLAAVVGVSFSIGLPAQTRPNLSGTWRVVGAATQPVLTIAQTADEISIGPISERDPTVVTVSFDGREGRRTLRGPDGSPNEMTFRAAWEGQQLILLTSMTNTRGTISLKAALSVKGDTLTIETTGTNPDGSAIQGTTLTYARGPVQGPIPAPPTRTVESGYTSLFNGKDLGGWKAGGPAEAFSIESGAIVARGVAGGATTHAHLYYDGEVRNHAFQNFDLKLDIMARNRSNGGVYIMTEYQATGFPSKGFEVQVNNSHTDRIRSGSLYHVVDLSYVPAKDDEWFPMEIMVKDDTITVTLKGNQVIRWTQPPDWNGAYDAPGRKIAPGTIAFQAHDPNSLTAYANIRIRPLP